MTYTEQGHGNTTSKIYESQCNKENTRCPPCCIESEYKWNIKRFRVLGRSYSFALRTTITLINSTERFNVITPIKITTSSNKDSSYKSNDSYNNLLANENLASTRKHKTDRFVGLGHQNVFKGVCDGKILEHTSNSLKV